MITAYMRNFSPSDGGIRRQVRCDPAYVAPWLLRICFAALPIWMDALGIRASCESGHTWGW